MVSIFRCPVCGGRMTVEKSYICDNYHCFDRAKEGYVNLLLSNSAKGSISGDDKDMVKARTHFLQAGHYAPLKDALCQAIKQTQIQSPIIFDSGCGEGYYTHFYCHVAKSMGGRVAGIDISKAAVRHASKSCTDAEFAVSSVYRLPIADESVDIIINCFSPLAIDEFYRTLKKGGYFFYVVPDEEHLWEMKCILYDKPYKNQVRNEQYAGFKLCRKISVKNTISLNSTNEILSLFRMTPYAWKTSKEAEERLYSFSSLTTRSEFIIFCFVKD